MGGSSQAAVIWEKVREKGSRAGVNGWGLLAATEPWELWTYWCSPGRTCKEGEPMMRPCFPCLCLPGDIDAPQNTYEIQAHPTPQAPSGQAGISAAASAYTSSSSKSMCPGEVWGWGGGTEVTKSPCAVATCATQITRHQDSTQGHPPELPRAPVGQISGQNHSCSPFPRGGASL